MIFKEQKPLNSTFLYLREYNASLSIILFCLKDDVLPKKLSSLKCSPPKANGYYHPLAISFPGFGVFGELDPLKQMDITSPWTLSSLDPWTLSSLNIFGHYPPWSIFRTLSSPNKFRTLSSRTNFWTLSSPKIFRTLSSPNFFSDIFPPECFESMLSWRLGDSFI